MPVGAQGILNRVKDEIKNEFAVPRRNGFKNDSYDMIGRLSFESGRRGVMKHDGCLSQGSQLLTKRQRESTSSDGIIKVKREEEGIDASNLSYNKMDTVLSPSGKVEG